MHLNDDEAGFETAETAGSGSFLADERLFFLNYKCEL